MIGFLWAGTMLLGLGCTVAAIRRYLELRTMPAGPVLVPAVAVAGPGSGASLGLPLSMSSTNSRSSKEPRP
jgi:hypothetical protein